MLARIECSHPETGHGWTLFIMGHIISERHWADGVLGAVTSRSFANGVMAEAYARTRLAAQRGTGYTVVREQRMPHELSDPILRLCLLAHWLRDELSQAVTPRLDAILAPFHGLRRRLGASSLPAGVPDRYTLVPELMFEALRFPIEEHLVVGEAVECNYALLAQLTRHFFYDHPTHIQDFADYFAVRSCAGAEALTLYGPAVASCGDLVA